MSQPEDTAHRIRTAPSPAARTNGETRRAAVAAEMAIGGHDGNVDSLREAPIARPDLFDPNFRRTVILVGEHTEEGALGVVLNPHGMTVAETAPAWPGCGPR